jgi:ribonucleoside-diphosphate reductase alpha chain
MSNVITAPVSTNGFVRQTMSMTPEQVAEEWTCKKRDGKVVPFDVKKIRKALFRCFNAVMPEGLTADVEKTVEKITKAVVNVIEAKHLKTPEVEQVQQFIIQQLWGEGLFEAAEHYQNYREAHKKARLAKPIPPEVLARVQEDQKHFPLDLQYYQFMSKFSRWKETEKRRETWYETVYERVMPWLKSVPGVRLTEAEWKELSDAMYGLEASPAMRVVQMAGPALDRCNVGVYNCAYQPLSDLFAFPEMLYILMQGTGEGFSCESEYVSDLPRIKKQKKVKPDTIVVDDSTEGWCNSYFEFLQRLWDGHDAYLDTSAVRKKGTRLKTKGGRASGPEPFLELISFARNMVKSKQGRCLDDIDAHDLACMTGKIVQVGGVRRAAEISLSDLSSNAMRHAKSGNWWEKSVHRSMANNSAVYDFDGPPPMELFMDEWVSLMKSRAGERGIFNRRAAFKHSPKRRKWNKMLPGCNPCAEILLRPWEFCNLTMAIARPDDTIETLKRKVRIATIFGKIQSMCTKFGYIRQDWKQNCEEERLLGVDITGHADCPLIRNGAPGRAELLRTLKQVVEETDIALSARWGVNRSAADTTIKPGGDSAVFFNCASGVSPWFAAHQIRWVRESIGSPIAKFLIESGVPHAPAPEAPDNLLVFGFPRQAPKGATLRNDMPADVQFFNWLEWKKNWAEHSVSATIYVEYHEWLKLGSLVYEHIDEITGLSFLPKDNGTYTYAPNEELTEEKYAEFAGKFPELNWAKLAEYENEDMTEAAQTFACVGDKC